MRLYHSGRVLPAALLILAGFLLAACGGGGEPTFTPQPSPPPTATPTLAPTDTPTPQPAGSSANPVVMAVVSVSGDAQVQAAGDEIADRLATLTGYSYSVQIFGSYLDLMRAMQNHRVQIGWLPPFTYLEMQEKGYADAALVTNHFGVTSYGAQFLANAASGFTPYYDATRSQNTAGAAIALQQFAGKLPCWVDLQSASGYIVPKGMLAQAGVTPPEGTLLLSHGAVIRALYIGGICDYGATFAISGDPRTAASIQAELPDVMEKVPVIWRSDAIIPNLNVSFSPDLPVGIAQLTRDALVRLASDAEGRQALTALNEYDVSDLKVIDDSYYDALRAALEASGVDLRTLLGK